jgi:hypothetical protein
MNVTCPNCLSSLNVPTQIQGRSYACPACDQPFLIPIPTAFVPPQPTVLTPPPIPFFKKRVPFSNTLTVIFFLLMGSIIVFLAALNPSPRHSKEYRELEAQALEQGISKASFEDMATRLGAR